GPPRAGRREPEHDDRRAGRADRREDGRVTALTWSESMEGRVAFDTDDYNQGWWLGTPCSFHIDVSVEDPARFFDDPEHEATGTGVLDCAGLGGRMTIEQGAFNLLPRGGTGARPGMRYPPLPR